jgi:hypothetical protein
MSSFHWFKGVLAAMSMAALFKSFEKEDHHILYYRYRGILYTALLLFVFYRSFGQQTSEGMFTLSFNSNRHHHFMAV